MNQINHTEPMVTISCVCYNHEKYIEKTLDSFLMQKTDFAFEVIIHDDASTDKTQDIIRVYQEKYPDIIKPVLQKENQFSKGITTIHSTYTFPKAQGKYIAMCDGDDYWTDPYKLQKQVDKMEKDEECGLVYTATNYYYQDKNEYKERFPHIDLYKYNGKTFEKLLLDTFNPIRTSTVCFRKSLLSKFDYSETNKQKFKVGDFALWLTLSKYSRFYYLPEVTTVYRIHNSLTKGNLSTGINLIKGGHEVRKFFYKTNKKELGLGMYIKLKLLFLKYKRIGREITAHLVYKLK